MWICMCKCVHRATIADMVKDGSDLEKIQAVTGAGTGCGKCVEQIKQIISEGKKNDEEEVDEEEIDV